MKTLTKVMSAAALAGLMAAPLTAQAWGGWGPWGNRGHDGMPQPHATGRLGHAPGFFRVQRQRLRSVHRTKRAGARAALATDHECGRAFGPAFPMVGALSTLADGVQSQPCQQPSQRAGVCTLVVTRRRDVGRRRRPVSSATAQSRIASTTLVCVATTTALTD